MDIKTDDILNVDDSDLLLCYGLDKLNLDSIPDDILDFTEAISKSESSSAVDGAFSENCSTESPVAEDESKKVTPKAKTKTPSKNIKRKIDINGNEAYENLNELFVKLELSDSEDEGVDGKKLSENKETDSKKISEIKETDAKKISNFENEEADGKKLSDTERDKAEEKEFSDSGNEEGDEEDSKLIERGGPIKPPKRASRSRRQKDIWSRFENHDKSEFDSQKLRFLSGSSQVQLTQSSILNVPVENRLTPIFCENNFAHPLSTQEYYDDVRAQSMSSPESGYESSATSLTNSPPPHLPLLNLETVDEQHILDIIDSALMNNSLSAFDVDGNDPQNTIKEIKNYLLKDIPGEGKSSGAVVDIVEENIQENVPLGGLNSSSLTLLPVLNSPVSRNVETHRNLVYRLEDKAKNALRQFLFDDEFYAIKKTIYKKINEDIANQKKVKVICVENETDKASENRTNLHHAVLNTNVEQIYCLVEIHKQYGLPLSDINIRDKYGKTALDYAVQNEMTHVVDYLKENTACQSVNIKK